MGSNSSKSAPTLQRSDTNNSTRSTRSNRSIRLRRSISSIKDSQQQQSDSQQQQQEEEEQSQSQSQQRPQPILSRNNSATSENPILIRRNTNETLQTPNFSDTLSPHLHLQQQQQQPGSPLSTSMNGNTISRTSTNHSIISTTSHKSSLQQSNLPLKKETTTSSLSTNSNTIDIDSLIDKLLNAGFSGKRTKNVCLKNTEIELICASAREIFLSQPSLLELAPPVKVVGDVHGQYHDLIRIFSKCGFPPKTNYLFLGDYVDRGKQSLETILLLLCYKIKYPENFFLLRGNHECANVTRVYGFYDECKRRCNIKTWKLFIDTFNTLPIAAIVAGKIFCVHGGLSPVLNSMDEIRNIARPTDVPDFGLLNDLLWSDPADTINEWEDNERGVSYVFSKVAINKFLSKFNFDLVCRAHMVVEDGYEFFNDRTLVTVFSAPNYCGEFDNWGAVMGVLEDLLCSFELLDPLDSAALKQVMKKEKQERKKST